MSLWGLAWYSIRPSACLGAALLAACAHRPLHGLDTFIIFLAVFTGSASCFLINDIYDRKKDLLNGKSRPIATGEFPAETASFFATILGLLYLLLSYSVGLFQVFVGLITLAIFLIYPQVNQRSGLGANVLVSLTVLLTIFYGYGGLKAINEFWPILISLFFTVLSREVLLDLLDAQGDEMTGKPSLAINLGALKSFRIVIMLLLMASLPWIFLLRLTQTSGIKFLYLMIILALLVPLLVSSKMPIRQRALFNIRTSHLYFAFVIVILYLSN